MMRRLRLWLGRLAAWVGSLEQASCQGCDSPRVEYAVRAEADEPLDAELYCERCARPVWALGLLSAQIAQPDERLTWRKYERRVVTYDEWEAC